MRDGEDPNSGHFDRKQVARPSSGKYADARITLLKPAVDGRKGSVGLYGLHDLC